VQGSEAEVAPLTSFDWSCHDVSKIITSSINKNCVLWDIEVKFNILLTVAALHDEAIIRSWHGHVAASLS
jgi:hypothetical protein